MRTQDQTLLARFGFRDPDAGNDLHYLACKFITTPPVHEAVARVAWPNWVRDSITSESGVNRGRHLVDPRELGVPDGWRVERREERVYLSDPPRFTQFEIHLERPITKSLQFVVGFVDVELEHSWSIPFQRTFRHWEQPGSGAGRRFEPTGEWTETNRWRCAHEGEIAYDPVGLLTTFVEVKIKKCPIDAIAKQISLYRSFLLESRFVVATYFDISRSDAEVLKRAGANHVRLGKGFEAYCAAARVEPAAQSMEI